MHRIEPSARNVGAVTIARMLGNRQFPTRPSSEAATLAGQSITLSQNATSTVAADAVKVVRDDSSDPNTATETYSYAYDPSGDMNAITDSGNGAPAASYDVNYSQLNQVSEIKQLDGSGSQVHDTTFGYDADGDMPQLVNDGQTSTYAYDHRNRKIVKSPVAFAVLSLATWLMWLPG